MRDTRIALSALLRFCFTKKVLKILNFRTFLPVKEPSLATLSETRALSSGKNVVKQDLNISDLPQTFKIYWWHCTIFTLEKCSQKYKLFSFFISKRIFGGYFK